MTDDRTDDGKWYLRASADAAHYRKERRDRCRNILSSTSDHDHFERGMGRHASHKGDSIMSMPGFHAESSLYRSGETYYSAGSGPVTGSVLPQLPIFGTLGCRAN